MNDPVFTIASRTVDPLYFSLPRTDRSDFYLVGAPFGLQPVCDPRLKITRALAYGQIQGGADCMLLPTCSSTFGIDGATFSPELAKHCIGLSAVFILPRVIPRSPPTVGAQATHEICASLGADLRSPDPWLAASGSL